MADFTPEMLACIHADFLRRGGTVEGILEATKIAIFAEAKEGGAVEASKLRQILIVAQCEVGAFFMAAESTGG